MSCVFVWESFRAIKAFSGFVSGPDFFQSTEVIARDPRFDRLRVIHNDFLKITGHSIDEATCRRVNICRRGALRTNPNFRVTFVAVGEVAAQLARSIETSDHSMPFFPNICSSLADAQAWFDGLAPLDSPREVLTDAAAHQAR